MRRIGFLISAALLISAQAPPPMPPATQAMQSTIIRLTGESLEWQTKAFELQAQVTELKQQLEAAKAKPVEPAKP